MPEPKRAGRLEGIAAAGLAVAGPEPVSLEVLADRGILLLRLADEAIARAAAALGGDLPGPLRSGAVGGDGAEALWLGPDAWLVLTPDPGAAHALTERLRGALAGAHHAVVDVGHRFTGIAVDGRRSRDVLNAGCPLDLHPRTFPPGGVARTLLGKATVILARRSGDRFELLVDGSFAPYAWLFLENAAREHGYRATVPAA